MPCKGACVKLCDLKTDLKIRLLKMRIISGKFGGRIIKTGNGGARPAMGRTREALFSILESRGIIWENLRVLDVFAGTGSLGFEALSRGAAHVDFVDNSPELCKTLRLNAEALDILDSCGIFCEEARKFMARRPNLAYGLVFIDPPYRKNLASHVISALPGRNFLHDGSFVCAEIEKGAEFDVPPALQLRTRRNFGQTTLEIWEKA